MLITGGAIGVGDAAGALLLPMVKVVVSVSSSMLSVSAG